MHTVSYTHADISSHLFMTSQSSHDSSGGEWMHLTICPLCGQGLIPGHGGVFQGIFFRLITLCQPTLSQHGRNGSRSPQWHHTAPNHWQIMADECQQFSGWISAILDVWYLEMLEAGSESLVEGKLFRINFNIKILGYRVELCHHIELPLECGHVCHHSTQVAKMLHERIHGFRRLVEALAGTL